jgi:hypothetical protein
VLPSRHLESSDQILHARDLVALEVGIEPVDELPPEERIGEVRGADLDGRRARNDELERVLDRRDPAAIGRIAGPLRPPRTFESLGVRVSTSIAIARNVLTSEIASAPASSDARANDATSVTLGVSFGISGSDVTLRTPLTTS